MLLLVLLLLNIAWSASLQHRNVNVELRAKWSGTPLLLEMGELLAKENSDSFWKFIDAWLESEPSQNSSECVKEILSHGTSLVDGHLAPILELSLSIRSASPKLVVYKQLAQDSLFAHNSSYDRWMMSSNLVPPAGKCCWIDVGPSILLEDSQLFDWLESASGRSLPAREPDLFEFDHIYPRLGSLVRTAVLYGALGTTCFKRFHSILSEASEKGVLRYVLRPVLPTGCEAHCSACTKIGAGRTLNLAGYGVELALKNMEYRAIDDSEVKTGGTSGGMGSENLNQDVGGFIFSKLAERKPHLEVELMTFRDLLLSSEISESLNVWEVKDLGYQASQRIVSASEPLRLMQELNQNFPKLVSSLSRMKINDMIKQEILLNQQLVSPGRNLLAINGALVNAESIDLFKLIHMIHEEVSFASKIARMNVPPSALGKLLRLPEPAEQNVVRLDFRSKEFVHYLNDLEEDPKYKRWRTNINELLMPVFPGQLRYIRKNLYHAVYVIDPSSAKGLKVLEMIMNYYNSNFPLRFGLILLSPELVTLLEETDGAITKDMHKGDLSSLVIRLFLYLKNNQGSHDAFEFLFKISEASEEQESTEESLVEEVFTESVRRVGKDTTFEIFSKLKSGEDYKQEVIETSRYVWKLGLSSMYPSLVMNGLVYGPSQAQFATVMAMNEELPRLQEAVYFGNINSQTDVLEKLLSEEGFKRYNPKIAGGGKDLRYISLALPVIDGHPVVTSLKYLHASGTEDGVKPVTHWLAVDLTQESGVRLLKQAIRYLMDGTGKARVGVLHNIKGHLDSSDRFLLPRFVSHVIHTASRRVKLLRFLEDFLARYKPLKHTFDEALNLFLETAHDAGLNSSKLREDLSKQEMLNAQILQFNQDRSFVSGLLGVEPGSNAVITNGRLIIQDDKPFIAEDFALLESMEYRRRIKDIQEIIEDVKWEMEADDITSEFLSTTIMAVSSAMASRVRSSETAHFELLKTEYSAVVRHVDGSPLQIDAVINPLSAVAQKLAPLLLMLDEWLHPSIRIVLNPMNSLPDLPLKNFYRYVLPSKGEFAADGRGSYASFANMPQARTLTMNLDVPEPWLVEPVVAIHDLDNIVLEKLGEERTLHAVFELEALMITGHCYEGNDPPRGLQLILGTKQHPHIVDTIVMANLGYFQLKAAPGAWILRLANGRSSELYTLQIPKERMDEGPLSKRVVVADFRGELVHLEVVKRRGKEEDKLLDTDKLSTEHTPSGKTKGFFDWAAGMMKRRDNEENSQARHGGTINIFSVASGHLYERFLKIMMLSVVKNTRRPVKFWFIKNYLSPQFKDLIPHMAQEYGFDYELVTYKWPTWLQKQTEKQRIIWAYKILFLDVIFPLSLKKVIFVDADQVVRADMGELYDMDIKGRPLAYTPFCENNREMDGYRFWSKGFWKEHLQDKAYHISALYVVDLHKFRQTAAGDNLRVFYESLSKDPNSLSNLDQDLPNYAQHTVPIYSLPQEWLWCESWCGNATKARAKTIDLCNNPMTKEPKLQGAKRIVKEWPALDEEAREFTNKILGSDDASASVMPTPKSEPSLEDYSIEGKDEL